MPSIRMLTIAREAMASAKAVQNGIQQARRSVVEDNKDVATKTDKSESARAAAKTDRQLKSAVSDKELAKTKGTLAAWGALAGAASAVVGLVAAGVSMAKSSKDKKAEEKKEKADKAAGKPEKTPEEQAAKKAADAKTATKNIAAIGNAVLAFLQIFGAKTTDLDTSGIKKTKNKEKDKGEVSKPETNAADGFKGATSGGVGNFFAKMGKGVGGLVGNFAKDLGTNLKDAVVGKFKEMVEGIKSIADVGKFLKNTVAGLFGGGEKLDESKLSPEQKETLKKGREATGVLICNVLAAAIMAATGNAQGAGMLLQTGALGTLKDIKAGSEVEAEAVKSEKDDFKKQINSATSPAEVKRLTDNMQAKGMIDKETLGAVNGKLNSMVSNPEETAKTIIGNENAKIKAAQTIIDNKDGKYTPEAIAKAKEDIDASKKVIAETDPAKIQQEALNVALKLNEDGVNTLSVLANAQAKGMVGTDKIGTTAESLDNIIKGASMDDVKTALEIGGDANALKAVSNKFATEIKADTGGIFGTGKASSAEFEGQKSVAAQLASQNGQLSTANESLNKENTALGKENTALGTRNDEITTMLKSGKTADGTRDLTEDEKTALGVEQKANSKTIEDNTTKIGENKTQLGKNDKAISDNMTAIKGFVGFDNPAVAKAISDNSGLKASNVEIDKLIASGQNADGTTMTDDQKKVLEGKKADNLSEISKNNDFLQQRVDVLKSALSGVTDVATLKDLLGAASIFKDTGFEKEIGKAAKETIANMIADPASALKLADILGTTGELRTLLGAIGVKTDAIDTMEKDAKIGAIAGLTVDDIKAVKPGEETELFKKATEWMKGDSDVANGAKGAFADKMMEMAGTVEGATAMLGNMTEINKLLGDKAGFYRGGTFGDSDKEAVARRLESTIKNLTSGQGTAEQRATLLTAMGNSGTMAAMSNLFAGFANPLAEDTKGSVNADGLDMVNKLQTDLSVKVATDIMQGKDPKATTTDTQLAGIGDLYTKLSPDQQKEFLKGVIQNTTDYNILRGLVTGTVVDPTDPLNSQKDKKVAGAGIEAISAFMQDNAQQGDLKTLSGTDRMFASLFSKQMKEISANTTTNSATNHLMATDAGSKGTAIGAFLNYDVKWKDSKGVEQTTPQTHEDEKKEAQLNAIKHATNVGDLQELLKDPAFKDAIMKDSSTFGNLRDAMSSKLVDLAEKAAKNGLTYQEVEVNGKKEKVGEGTNKDLADILALSQDSGLVNDSAVFAKDRGNILKAAIGGAKDADTLAFIAKNGGAFTSGAKDAMSSKLVELAGNISSTATGTTSTAEMQKIFDLAKDPKFVNESAVFADSKKDIFKAAINNSKDIEFMNQLLGMGEIKNDPALQKLGFEKQLSLAKKSDQLGDIFKNPEARAYIASSPEMKNLLASRMKDIAGNSAEEALKINKMAGDNSDLLKYTKTTSNGSTEEVNLTSSVKDAAFDSLKGFAKKAGETGDKAALEAILNNPSPELSSTLTEAQKKTLLEEAVKGSKTFDNLKEILGTTGADALIKDDKSVKDVIGDKFKDLAPDVSDSSIEAMDDLMQGKVRTDGELANWFDSDSQDIKEKLMETAAKSGNTGAIDNLLKNTSDPKEKNALLKIAGENAGDLKTLTHVMEEEAKSPDKGVKESISRGHENLAEKFAKLGKVDETMAVLNSDPANKAALQRALKATNNGALLEKIMGDPSGANSRKLISGNSDLKDLLASRIHVALKNETNAESAGRMQDLIAKHTDLLKYEYTVKVNGNDEKRTQDYSGKLEKEAFKKQLNLTGNTNDVLDMIKNNPTLLNRDPGLREQAFKVAIERAKSTGDFTAIMGAAKDPDLQKALKDDFGKQILTLDKLDDLKAAKELMSKAGELGSGSHWFTKDSYALDKLIVEKMAKECKTGEASNIGAFINDPKNGFSDTQKQDLLKVAIQNMGGEPSGQVIQNLNDILSDTQFAQMLKGSSVVFDKVNSLIDNAKSSEEVMGLKKKLDGLNSGALYNALSYTSGSGSNARTYTAAESSERLIKNAEKEAINKFGTKDFSNPALMADMKGMIQGNHSLTEKFISKMDKLGSKSNADSKAIRAAYDNGDLNGFFKADDKSHRLELKEKVILNDLTKKADKVDGGFWDKFAAPGVFAAGFGLAQTGLQVMLDQIQKMREAKDLYNKANSELAAAVAKRDEEGAILDITNGSSEGPPGDAAAPVAKPGAKVDVNASKSGMAKDQRSLVDLERTNKEDGKKKEDKAALENDPLRKFEDDQVKLSTGSSCLVLAGAASDPRLSGAVVGE